MKNIYDITIDVHEESIPVTLTEPTGMELMLSGIQVPDGASEGQLPESEEEREEYEAFVEDIVGLVSDFPVGALDELPALSVSKLFFACANVCQGEEPQLDKFDTDNDETSENSDDSVEDSHALSQNSYPHFEGKQERPDHTTRIVARGE